MEIDIRLIRYYVLLGKSRKGQLTGKSDLIDEAERLGIGIGVGVVDRIAEEENGNDEQRSVQQQGRRGAKSDIYMLKITRRRYYFNCTTSMWIIIDSGGSFGF